jgi:hypothetical protein
MRGERRRQCPENVTISFVTLAGDKISEAPTPVLREIVNKIKNSNDIKYQNDNAK